MENISYTGNTGHTFASDLAAARYAAKQQMVMASLTASVSLTKESASAMVAAFKSGDAAKVKEASDHLYIAMIATQDAMAGNFNAITERNKAVNSSVMPMWGRVIEVFINQLGDELTAIDDTWMLYTAMDVLEGTSKGTIFEVVNGVIAYQLVDPTDDVQMSPYKSATWEGIVPEFYAAGVRVDRLIVENDPMTSINNIAIAIRIALLKKKTEVAFLRVQAAITAAIAAGNTTAYTGASVPKTLNAAYLALIQRNRNKGYSLTASTQVVLTGNESHRSTVESVFEITVNSLINNSNGTIRSRYPITRAYTFNLDADLGNSGEKVVLILPYRRIRCGMFRGQTVESQMLMANAAHEVYGRESYNFLHETDQFQIATIA
jgi:hypothetical protein